MTQAPPTPAEIVTSQSQLSAAFERIARSRQVAFDLESNGFHRYPERICLLQIGIPDQVYIIDPLVVREVASLGAVLADASVEKIFHSSDYDLRSLDREWGFRVNNLYDTSIASSFTGSERLGLGSVLEEHLKVVVPKEKKLQRSDWTLRPLNEESLDYAASDVRHLIALREVLNARLAGLGREGWAAEEFNRMSQIRYTPPDPETGFLYMKGSIGMDGRQLAVLKALVEFREREARRVDRAYFRVIPDAALLALSMDPATDLAKVVGLGRYAYHPQSKGLLKALEAGVNGPIFLRPPPARLRWPRVTPAERDIIEGRLRSLKEWRTEQSKSYHLDPALVWPAISLERLAHEPQTLGTEMAAPEVRRWQVKEFGNSLETKLAVIAAEPEEQVRRNGQSGESGED